MGELATTTNESDPASVLRPIGRYQPIAVLGSGGMATVYLALMRGRSKFSKLVVLKMPHRQVADDPSLRGMFLDEARIAARINHPNVVQTYEIVEEEGRDIIVMEYLDGSTLNEVLARAAKKSKPLPLGMHVRIILEAVRGLHAAHELTDYNGSPLGLVHRDVSPHNVIVTFDGHVKVLDFGVAKAALSSHKTEAGTFKGKVRYMPREQLMGAENVDRRADIFALGVVLWEAATGVKLWTGTPEPEVMTRVVEGKIPSPRDVNPNADARLDEIVRKAMSREPEDRYASCVELEADVDRFLDSLPEKYSLRDAGKFIADLFSEVRSRRTSIIEGQIARAEAQELAPSSGVLDVGTLPSASAAWPRQSFTDEGSPRSIAGSITGSFTGRTGTGTGVNVATPKPRQGSSLFTKVAIGVALVGALAVVVTRTKTPAPAPAAAVAPPPAVPAVVVTTSPTTSPSSAEVKLSLTARPGNARLKLDEMELPANPANWSVKRDGASHILRVEAKGFVTKLVEVHYDGDKEVSVTLEPEPPPSVRGWAPSPPVRVPAAPAAARPEPAPEPKPAAPTAAPPQPQQGGNPKRPTRPIDDSL